MITKREILFSTIILSIMIGLGIWISNPIVGALTENALEVVSAVRVYDAEKFGYIKRTNVGMFLAEGELIAIDTIRLADFPGIYSKVVKVKEEYREHTETYTETDDKGNTTTHVRTYYSWDEEGREILKSESFSFLGEKFTAREIGYSIFAIRDTTVYNKRWGSDVRYVYYTTPVAVKGLMEGKAVDKKLTNLKFNKNYTIKQKVENAERNREIMPIVFWILWIVLTVVIIWEFYNLQNYWLYTGKYTHGNSVIYTGILT